MHSVSIFNILQRRGHIPFNPVLLNLTPTLIAGLIRNLENLTALHSGI